MRYVLPAFLVLAFLAVPSSAEEKLPPFIHGEAVLAELPGVYMSTERLDREHSKLGLTRKRISDVVEPLLRQRRIPILTKAEWLKSPGSPTLNVGVGLGGNGFTVDVQLAEVVTLQRRKADTIAWTWAFSITGTHGGEAQRVLDALRDCVEKFALVWLKQNADPKAAKAKKLQDLRAEMFAHQKARAKLADEWSEVRTKVLPAREAWIRAMGTAREGVAREAYDAVLAQAKVAEREEDAWNQRRRELEEQVLAFGR